MWLILYTASVVLVNVGFATFGAINTPFGAVHPMSLVVGIIFVLRDVAQARHGHSVVLAMAAGVAISYFMASPTVAIVSAAAFAASETIDWIIFSLMKHSSMRRRAIASSAVAAPIDSAIFLAGIGAWSAIGLIVMIFSKLVGVAVAIAFLDREK